MAILCGAAKDSLRGTDMIPMILGQFCKEIFFAHSRQLYTVTGVGYNLSKITQMFG